MNVVFATDNNYAQHCLVALTSLAINNVDVHVFIIVPPDFDFNVKTLFEQSATRWHFILNWVIIPDDFVSRLPLPSGKNIEHISLAAYYRLFIPELLPDNIDKVIYLDCDIVVCGSIYELWSIDIKGKAMAACDPRDCQFAINIRAYERLLLPKNYAYFNSGVLIINLAFWRKEEVQKQFLCFITKNYHNIIYHDQDVLNAVLYDRTVYFSEQYNMQRTATENDGVFENPVIVHFSSVPKPWNWYCNHPLKHLYFEVLDKLEMPRWRPSWSPKGLNAYIIKPLLRRIKQKITIKKR